MGIKRTIVLPEILYKRLQYLAEKKSLTVSGIIKLACSTFLEQEENK